jgi:diadenosine tetraphosphate (Ap4A) HIT family hydrolase
MKVGDDSECHLCDILRYGVGQPYLSLFPKSDLKTEVIAESENFVAILDIGPIIEGYILVFTRVHEVAFSEITEDAVQELEHFINYLAKALKTAYGVTPQVFEHGSTGLATARGCCVEHAHLHIIPFGGQLLSTSDIRQFRQIEGLQELLTTSDNSDYLYLRDPQGSHWIWETNSAPQQYFRRLLSKAVCEDLWNWQDYVLLHDATNTRVKLLKARERLLPLLVKKS